MTRSNGGRQLITRAILATAFAAAAWGDSVIIGPSRDNTLYESATGSRSNGAGQYLFVGRTGQQSDSRRRGVVAFDIAGNIPADATIDSVTLTLYMSRTVSGAQTISLHRLNADWGEGTSNASGQEGAGAPSTANDATWKHTFYDTKNWSNTGGDYQAAASANVSVASVGFHSLVSTAKIVADVQGWLDNPAGTFGWILIGNEGTSKTAKRFDTRENPDSGKRPLLTVVFTLPPPDCNGNGVDDAKDIANGTSQDCNGNGIPDECDIDPADPDGNGLVSTDCDGNGVPDECQPDSDNDGVIDLCDNCPTVANPGQADSDADGAGDACDGCPNNPNKTDPGVCGCEQPDTDSDGDGVPDCLDACPDDPSKTEPGDCGCGEPDVDSDGDGVPDCVDGCPNDPKKTVPGKLGCGVEELDSDGDGVPDSVDGCPNDPNKSEPGDCGCGQAETDTDGDGIPDCLDGCPDDPNKSEPGDCGCGVPDVDSDGDGVFDCFDMCPGQDDTLDSDNDGVPDCEDACPNDAAKTEPGDCGCGQPDIDSDADGILDCVDNCPETANPDQSDADGDGVGDVCDADFVVDDPDGNGKGDQDPPPDDKTDGMIPADCGADLCAPSMMPLIVVGIAFMKSRTRVARRRR